MNNYRIKLTTENGSLIISKQIFNYKQALFVKKFYTYESKIKYQKVEIVKVN